MLSKLRSKKRIQRSWPIWITEFGFQSRPPDPYATPIEKIPGFMGQSEYIAFKNSRVASFSQYPLIDDAGRADGFQSGLRFHNGKKKPGRVRGVRAAVLRTPVGLAGRAVRRRPRGLRWQRDVADAHEHEGQVAVARHAPGSTRAATSTSA